MSPKELKNIAPKLFEIKNLENNFCVPNDYFDNFEENISASIFLGSLDRKNSFEIPENYLNLVESSVLEKIKTEDKSVPENYFDTIENRVFEKINNQPKVISLKQRVIQKFAPIAVAASVLLIFTFQFFSTPQEDEFVSINGDDIELWLNNGNIKFNDSELAYLYEDTVMESVSIFDFHEEEEVYDYLNALDVESLILTN